ncbi:hypothetical protein KUL25_07485 [Rhodobacteraceae bacterium N5(2021)]|uniref:Uncharacterized protein n=1 Tax=Gymnodinialimonas phycosphaerae TaxID=2841589 RepID=A0A975TYZ8_9RHOB|nr:hypothetical protein [Gymnodinialimonas phycosphaerae]MBY4892605.1 hypothetical protein [Gymnodinialimonas phycosphaerae]
MTLLLGFAVIGGILAGYVTARLAPRWALWALWGGCAIIGGALVIWFLAFAPNDEIGRIIVLYGVFAPFAGCCVVAGVIGLVVRRTIAKEPLA